MIASDRVTAIDQPRNILVFADGTGNEGGLLPDESRTNVYKLYRATRVDPTTCIGPAEQIAFYLSQASAHQKLPAHRLIRKGTRRRRISGRHRPDRQDHRLLRRDHQRVAPWRSHLLVRFQPWCVHRKVSGARARTTRHPDLRRSRA